MVRSLSSQITRSLVAASVIALAGIIVGFTVSGYADRRNQVTESLHRLASDLADALTVTPDGHLTVDPSVSTWRVSRAANPDIAYIVLDPQNDELMLGSDSELASQLGNAWLHEWRESLFTVATPSGREIEGVATTMSVEDRPVRVIVGRLSRPAVDLLAWLGDEILGEILPSVLPALAASLVFVWLAVRQATTPIAETVQALRHLDPTRGETRLDVQAVPREIRPLVTAVNDAMARSAAAFDHERRFLADAAHELKTPVAVLRARIDGMTPGETRDRLAADVDRVGRLIERLLSSARFDSGAIRRQLFDLAMTTRSVVAELAPMVIAAGREIAYDGTDGALPFGGDEAGIAEALRNMISNALRFAPVGSTIEIALESGVDTVVLEVRDRGPGLPTGQPDDLFSPFVTTAPSGSGHAGLGLATVAAVARRHNGRCDALNREGGGAIFRMILPISPAAVAPGLA
ncbi:sensor histidine kinase [Zavarzinia sp.]|uniref:sensor histidine kinase n=1 Tax=Zavarzinia sp. TaxID=2027920 RepID=UPI003564E5A2